MANCCVESTMREACDKGFGVITLTDCVATTSMAGKKGGDQFYNLQPTPSACQNSDNFRACLQAQLGMKSGCLAKVGYDVWISSLDGGS